MAKPLGEPLYDFRILEVKKVTDGDTIVAIMDTGFGETTTRRIRLAIIDAPERKDPLYNEAKLFLQGWLADRHPNLRVRTYVEDFLGRWVGHIYDRRSGDVRDTASEAMLLAGMAGYYEG